MKCNLCEKEIAKYNTIFNHLIIDDNHSINICLDCSDKFIKWQGKICSIIFPTKAMKKMYEKK
ncbi:MAG: hypothetical protein PHN56_01320 [Candidatus Nanoarchaeia archaeon]|nr:hypothetical protein [Candidatus Nanoarchaeia archaeon]